MKLYAADLYGRLKKPLKAGIFAMHESKAETEIPPHEKTKNNDCDSLLLSRFELGTFRSGFSSMAAKMSSTSRKSQTFRLLSPPFCVFLFILCASFCQQYMKKA
jgi:hypothetical protein